MTAAPLPGADRDELLQYLTGHDDWVKVGKPLRGCQFWQHTTSDGVIHVSIPLDGDRYPDEVRELLADAAFKVARLELGLTGYDMREAVRRLAAVHNMMAFAETTVNAPAWLTTVLGEALAGTRKGTDQ